MTWWMAWLIVHSPLLLIVWIEIADERRINSMTPRVSSEDRS